MGIASSLFCATFFISIFSSHWAIASDIFFKMKYEMLPSGSLSILRKSLFFVTHWCNLVPPENCPGASRVFGLHTLVSASYGGQLPAFSV